MNFLELDNMIINLNLIQFINITKIKRKGVFLQKVIIHFNNKKKIKYICNNDLKINQTKIIIKKLLNNNLNIENSKNKILNEILN